MDKPNRICMLADSHGLYDDRIYWKEALSLSRSGYAVHFILVSDINENGSTSEGIQFVKIKRKVYFKNRYVNYLFKKILPGGIYNQMFNAAKAIKADVYHIHDLKVNRIGQRLKKLSWNPKVIYDVHEPYPENIVDYNQLKGVFSSIIKWYADHIRKWENKCAGKYDLVITTEENVRERFQKVMPREKVQIIYNYTDIGNSDPSSTVTEKIWDAIYTGGITRLRGAMHILRALTLAVKEKSDIQVLFLGTFFPPELKQEMQEFISLHKLERNVTLMNAVPYIEMDEYYRQSRIGLGIFLPIPTHKIILQIKIFEYLAFGLPIIGSNFGHIKNYIEKDNAGITVDPEKEGEIAYALVSLLKNRNRYNELSMNALKASKKYKWQIMEEKLIGIYQELLHDQTDLG